MRRLVTERYEPPSITPTVLVPLTLTFVALTVTRGVGWLTATPGTVPLVMLDNALGLPLWGGLLMAGGGWFWIAAGLRRHFLIWTGHAFLASVYFGVVLTTLPAVASHGGPQNLVAPVGAVLWHGLLARRMRPLPPHRGHRAVS